jgi:hypothetical protein
MIPFKVLTEEVKPLKHDYRNNRIYEISNIKFLIPSEDQKLKYQDIGYIQKENSFLTSSLFKDIKGIYKIDLPRSLLDKEMVITMTEHKELKTIIKTGRELHGYYLIDGVFAVAIQVQLVLFFKEHFNINAIVVASLHDTVYSMSNEPQERANQILHNDSKFVDYEWKATVDYYETLNDIIATRDYLMGFR